MARLTNVTYLGMDKDNYIIFDGNKVLEIDRKVKVLLSPDKHWHYVEGHHAHPFIHLESEQSETLFIPVIGG